MTEYQQHADACGKRPFTNNVTIIRTANTDRWLVTSAVASSGLSNVTGSGTVQVFFKFSLLSALNVFFLTHGTITIFVCSNSNGPCNVFTLSYSPTAHLRDRRRSGPTVTPV